MSRKMNIALITGAAIASLHMPTSLAQAPEDEDRSTGGSSMGMMEMDMSHMDQDGDGMVSRTEFMRMHEEMFSRMDQDRDGLLSEDEMDSGMGMMGGCMMNH